MKTGPASATARRCATNSSCLGRIRSWSFRRRTWPACEQADDEDKPLKIFVKYIGMLGPQGALPLATTEEAYHYVLANDDAFPRFLDLFNHRFLQLFFRAWANSRPIAQHDRPTADRFLRLYRLGDQASAPNLTRDLDSVPDAAKLGFAGLLGTRRRNPPRASPARSAGCLRSKAEVDEFVGTRLMLDAPE